MSLPLQKQGSVKAGAPIPLREFCGCEGLWTDLGGELHKLPEKPKNPKSSDKCRTVPTDPKSRKVAKRTEKSNMLRPSVRSEDERNAASSRNDSKAEILEPSHQLVEWAPSLPLPRPQKYEWGIYR